MTNVLMYLHELPRPQRAVLVLVDTLGWQPSEVAELLGVDVASVDDDLERARTMVARRRRDRLPTSPRPRW